jgi:hypothetical protein
VVVLTIIIVIIQTIARLPMDMEADRD